MSIIIIIIKVKVMGNSLTKLILINNELREDFDTLLEEEPLIASLLFSNIINSNDTRKEEKQSYRLGLKRSPWRKLLDNKSSNEFKLYLGVNLVVFDRLVSIFKSYIDLHEPSQRNASLPNIVYDANAKNSYINNKFCFEDRIGIILLYINSTCEMKYLGLLFGISRHRISRAINRDINTLVEALKDHPDARVSWPTDEEMADLIERTNRKYPMLERYNVWGAIDGCKVAIETSKDPNLQAAYYNGWLHSHVVVNVLLVDTRGVFRFAILNALGTTHDSQAARIGGLYEKVKAGTNVVGDSAFANVPGFIKLSERNVLDLQHGQNLRQVRQISEWAMHIFQLPRLHLKLPLHNNKLRQNLLSLSVLFNNFKVNNGMNNEITTAFDY